MSQDRILWWYELVACARPLQFHIIPTAHSVVLVDSTGLKAIGAAMWVVGPVIYGLALSTMGDSCRIGIDRDGPGALVAGRIFGWSKKPIYLGFDLCALGTFLLQGRLIFLVTALVLVIL